MPAGGRKHEDMPLHNHIRSQAFPERSAEALIHSRISVFQGKKKHWNRSFARKDENKTTKLELNQFNMFRCCLQYSA